MKTLFTMTMILCLAAGCRTVKPVRFAVSPDVTDHATITYHPAAVAGETHPIITRLEISGSGHVLCQRGRSPRVQNAYWRKPGGQYWHDIVTDQVILDPETTALYFQALVNAGLLDTRREAPAPEDPTAAYVSIAGKIDGKTGFLASNNPVLLDLYRSLRGRFRAAHPAK